MTRGKTCNKCGKQAHFSKMCQAKNQKVRYIAAVHDDSSTDDDFVFVIGQHLTKFPVVINNVPGNVIIDSGSSVNIITQDLYDKMEPKPTL